jgi:hypothetical protein
VDEYDQIIICEILLKMFSAVSAR